MKMETSVEGTRAHFKKKIFSTTYNSSHLDKHVWFEDLEVVLFIPRLVGLLDTADGVHLDEALFEQLLPVLLVGDGHEHLLLSMLSLMLSL